MLLLGTRCATSSLLRTIGCNHQSTLSILPFNMQSSKRPAPGDEHDPSISPPPLKRKIQSSVTESAVASFFTPASQKPKTEVPVAWSQRGPDDATPPTLLVARYTTSGNHDTPLQNPTKFALFDLDGTLIKTVSGNKFGKDAADWKWWDPSVPSRLRQMHNNGYMVAIFSNQGGIPLQRKSDSKAPKKSKGIEQWKQKATAILTQLNIPTTLYAATGKDIFRKPRPGMWSELRKDVGVGEEDVDKAASFFVGDAGGRAKDFSCSDRNFAHNVGIKYETPEEFFLGQQPSEFTRDFDLASYPASQPVATGPQNPAILFTKTNEKDIVLFCGPPGAGKSTFYWRYLEPLGYKRVNQDLLKTKNKCLKTAREHLEEGSNSVAVDSTNPNPDTRLEWVDLAKTHKVPIRCVWFRTPLPVAKHNDAARSMSVNKDLNPEARDSLPAIAFNQFTSRFQPPKTSEGFQDIVEVDFEFRGTLEEYAQWGRYWV